MAMSLAEAAKLTNDLVLRGVIETIVKDSSVLTMLPFMDVTGTAITYNREATMPAANFYAVGDTWSEATMTFTKKTATLSILGGDADVDNFIQQTYADPNDIEATVLANRAKAVAHKFSDTFFNGTVAGDANSFDGITTQVAAGQTLTAGNNGAALTLDMLDELIDLVKPGRPDALLMHKRTRRKLNSLRRASGNILETSLDMFGRHVLSYDGIPILVDDFMSIAETQGTENAATSIFAIKWGMDGVMGIHNGGVQIETVGELETKDATRHRIKWYCGIAVFSDLGLARLKGINGS